MTTTRNKVEELELRVRAVISELQDGADGADGGVIDVLFDVAEELSLLQQDIDLKET